MYRGLGATVYREIPGYAAWYAVYENVRALLVRPDAKEVNPFKAYFFLSVCIIF